MIYVLISAAFGENDKLIKIGYTENFNARKRQYLNTNPTIKTYKVIGKGDDGKHIEKILHYMFSKYRYPKHGKEWFIYNEEILSYFNQIEDYKSLEESAKKFVLDNSEGVYRFPKTKLDNKKVPEIDVDYIY